MKSIHQINNYLYRIEEYIKAEYGNHWFILMKSIKYAVLIDRIILNSLVKKENINNTAGKIISLIKEKNYDF